MSLKLALIDDDPIYSHYISGIFHDHGIKIQCFEDVMPFLDKLKEDPLAFNSIIVDRFIGNYDSLAGQFPRSCTYEGFRGKIVLISSGNLDHLADDIVKKGFSAWATKSGKIDWIGLISLNK